MSSSEIIAPSWIQELIVQVLWEAGITRYSQCMLEVYYLMLVTNADISVGIG